MKYKKRTFVLDTKRIARGVACNDKGCLCASAQLVSQLCGLSASLFRSGNLDMEEALRINGLSHIAHTIGKIIQVNDSHTKTADKVAKIRKILEPVNVEVRVQS